MGLCSWVGPSQVFLQWYGGLFFFPAYVRQKSFSVENRVLLWKILCTYFNHNYSPSPDGTKSWSFSDAHHENLVDILKIKHTEVLPQPPRTMSRKVHLSVSTDLWLQTLLLQVRGSSQLWLFELVSLSKFQSDSLPCKLSSDEFEKFSWGYFCSAFSCPEEEADDCHVL